MSSLQSPCAKTQPPPRSSLGSRPSRSFSVDHLPVFPAVALEVMDLIDQPDSSVRDITDLLRREPALAAETLRVSNSARYIRHKEQVLDLDTALVLIGLAEARRVALNAAVRGMIGGALGMPELRHCWTHCVAVAILSEELAGEYGQPQGRAYVAGLLHDLGMLALLSLYPAEYGEMLVLVERDQRDWREGERAIFGRDHEEVGSLLVDAMGLPASLRPILSAHHECVSSKHQGMLSLVAASDHLADALGFRVGGFLPFTSVEDVLASRALGSLSDRSGQMDRVRQRIEHATN